MFGVCVGVDVGDGVAVLVFVSVGDKVSDGAEVSDGAKVSDGVRVGVTVKEGMTVFVLVGRIWVGVGVKLDVGVGVIVGVFVKGAQLGTRITSPTSIWSPTMQFPILSSAKVIP